MKIKICGIKTAEEIEIVNEFCPDFIGFVFAKSKREIDFNKALELKARLNPKIKAAGVFVDTKKEDILKFKNVIDIVQLHGDYPSNTAEFLQNEGFEVIEVIKVQENSYKINSKANYVLFDTFSKTQAGGTNKTFGKNVQIESNVPFFIAGGLNENNIEETAKKYKPYALDVSSGAEVDGFKTKEKVSRIIELVRGLNI